MHGRGDRQQLEIAEMRGEEDMRLVLRREAHEQLFADDLDASRRPVVGVEVEELVEEHVFRREPGHVVPHFERDRLDLLLGLFRIGLAEIVERGAMAAEPGADRLRRGGREIQRLVGRQLPEQPEGAQGKAGDQPVIGPPEQPTSRGSGK